MVQYEHRVRAQRRMLVAMAKEAELEKEMREVEEMERRAGAERVRGAGGA